MGATILALYAILRIGSASPPVQSFDSGAPVSFAEARHVIDRRCGSCHSSQQSDKTFGPAPGGVTFDTPEQIEARAARILERAVVTRTMPPGNKTSISDAERALLGRWVAQLPR